MAPSLHVKRVHVLIEISQISKELSQCLPVQPPTTIIFIYSVDSVFLSGLCLITVHPKFCLRTCIGATIVLFSLDSFKFCTILSVNVFRMSNISQWLSVRSSQFYPPIIITLSSPIKTSRWFIRFFSILASLVFCLCASQFLVKTNISFVIS